MSRRIVVTAAFCMLMLAVPLGAAWGGKGEYEPSLKRDKEGWMYTTTDVNPSQDVRQVYFNGFQTQCAQVCTAIDTQLATLRTSVQTTDNNYQAMLGVWKDCNKDGYVGLADQGLTEYRAELLLDTSVCPKVTTPLTIPANWKPTHNDGEWVREFLNIGWFDTQSVVPCQACAQDNFDVNAYNFNDNKARVWADFGVPGATYGPSCPLVPVATGTLHRAGGVLHFADCLAGWHVTDTFDNTIVPLNPALNDYSFADHPRDQENSNSDANVKNPWGYESDGSYVQAWDCSKPRVTGTGIGKEPVFGGMMYANVSNPKVPPGTSTDTTHNSIAGTMNATGSGFDRCTRWDQNNGNDPQGLIYQSEGPNFHPGGALASAPYWLEYDVAGMPNKVKADGTMAPSDNRRGGAQYSPVIGQGAPDLPADTLGWGDGLWTDNTQWLGSFMVNRADLAPGKVSFHTFYASVSSDAIRDYGLALPKGTTTGVYGLEACGSARSGISTPSNWQCDPTKWYLDSFGKNLDRRSQALGKDPTSPNACDINVETGCIAYGARIGDSYNLRDIDCYDQSFQQARTANVHWGIVTGTTCDANNA